MILTTTVALVDIYHTLFEFVGKWRRNKRYVSAFAVNDSSTVILIKIHGRSRGCGCHVPIFEHPHR
jgi:hypothetical protein